MADDGKPVYGKRGVSKFPPEVEAEIVAYAREHGDAAAGRKYKTASINVRRYRIKAGEQLSKRPPEGRDTGKVAPGSRVAGGSYRTPASGEVKRLQEELKEALEALGRARLDIDRLLKNRNK